MVNRILFSIMILSNLIGQKDTASVAPDSPYYLSKRMDLPLAAVSTGLLVGAELVDVTPLTEDDINDLNKDEVSDFDYSATENWDENSIATSDLLLYSSIGFPAILLIDKEIRRDYKKFMSIWAETFVLTYGLTNLTKVLVSRPRPYLYGTSEGSEEHKMEDDNQRSFFSGHTSLSAASWFMMASMYQDYHPESKLAPYIWATAYLVPAATGYYRYDAGKHFLSDVLTGYFIGRAIGVMVPRWHKKSSRVDVGLMLLPSGEPGVQLTYRY
tara:strand:- start:1389 stop:2198 length:810 start_codon:yes stop_codon:yes gene_type:complete